MNASTVRLDAEELGVRYRHHRDMPLPWRFSFWMSVVGQPEWRNNVWMTIRPYVYVPDDVLTVDIYKHWQTLAHELVHWRQQRNSTPLLWLAKYAASQRFRWEQEREAYSVSIALGSDVSSVVAMLRGSYGIHCVPAEDMRRWFAAHPATV
jgi:hypothetical protein